MSRLLFKRLLGLFLNPLKTQQATIVITVSVGISLYPDHGEDAETLLRKADAAMYHVKNDAKNGYLLHSE